jgi:CheY-like chemotaxis protein
MIRVLVVEDNPNIRYLLTTILRQNGYEVVAADDGATAVSLLYQQSSFDGVLTDIQLPAVDGAQLVEIIKRDCPHTPVIVMSAYPERIEEALQRGAHNHIKKPFAYQKLLDTLRETVAGSVREPSS